MSRLIFCLSIVAVAALSGCKGGASNGPPPVYLVVVDTLRADVLGTYGGKRPTPFLDELAAQSVVFENCIAPSSWTVPSMASLFTGLYPFHHGAVKALQENGAVLSQQSLSSGWKTIAEYFQENNYKTYGISANGHLAEKYGFTQGFDEFVTLGFKSKGFLASSWASMAPRIGGEYRFGQPFFAFLFYFDPHHPYEPEEPYISNYRPNCDMSLVEKLSTQDMTQLWRDGFFEEHPQAVKLARVLYESEVAALDEHLRGAFQKLPGYEDAIVIFTSDHGEEFMEHGGMIHGNNLQQTQVHVPLFIKLPKNQHAGLRIKEPVSLVDVLPTLMGMIGGRVGKVDGRSLAPLWSNEGGEKRDLFTHLDMPWAHHTGAVRWPFKYIHKADGSRLVFNLEKDPAEKQNLFKEKDPAMVGIFREMLERCAYNVKYPPRVVSTDMPEELREKLTNLGYL